MQDFKDFYQQNRDFIDAFIIVIILCVAGAWLYHDINRNEPIYNDTDATMADIDKRIQGIESRLDTMSARLEQTQKTISGVAERVDRSTENAQAIAGGLQSAETRLDDAIQRSGRIENLISEIERTNK